MSFFELNIKQMIVLADKHGDKELINKLYKKLDIFETYTYKNSLCVIISQTITYADNRPLFKELSEFCLSNFKKTRFRYAIEFNQRMGYSQSRLREDDVTEFLINLYCLGCDVARNHQHFFSDEYQMFVDL